MNLSTIFKDVDSLIWFMVGLGSTFIFTGFGSVVSEVYMLTIAKSRKLSLSKMFVSTVCPAFLAILMINWYPTMSLSMYYSISFMLGLVGYQIARHITGLDFWIKLYNKFRK